MRITIATLAALAGLVTVAAQATPTLPAKAIPDRIAAPPVELARQGGGWSWHRVRWWDRWSYWHRDRSVPNW
jgi:hypothetical protein